jgi:hypothetical protein
MKILNKADGTPSDLFHPFFLDESTYLGIHTTKHLLYLIYRFYEAELRNPSRTEPHYSGGGIVSVTWRNHLPVYINHFL